MLPVCDFSPVWRKCDSYVHTLGCIRVHNFQCNGGWQWRAEGLGSLCKKGKLTTCIKCEKLS